MADYFLSNYFDEIPYCQKAHMQAVYISKLGGSDSCGLTETKSLFFFFFFFNNVPLSTLSPARDLGPGVIILLQYLKSKEDSIFFYWMTISFFKNMFYVET